MIILRLQFSNQVLTNVNLFLILVPGNIIKWRMKIVKFSNSKKVTPWIAMGIGLKN